MSSSSVLSIPDVVDSTIKNALKKSAASSGSVAGVGAKPGKMRGVFAFAKSHTFTLIGIIAVSLVIAVGVYLAMQHYKKKKKALNTDEEALAENGFLTDDDQDDEEEQQHQQHQATKPKPSTGAEDLPAGGGDEGPVDDPNWTPLEALGAPADE